MTVTKNAVFSNWPAFPVIVEGGGGPRRPLKILWIL